MLTPLTSKELFEAIECEMDRSSLQHVLLGLSLICHEKAEHIRVNWQDGTGSNSLLARDWETAGNRLDHVARNLPANCSE